jgi:hypothetical protein
MDDTSNLLLITTRILYSALEQEIGLKVNTNDPDRAKRALNQFRREVADPALSVLQIKTSPINPQTEIWIVRTTSVQEG